MCDKYNSVYINLDRVEDRRKEFEAQPAVSACNITRLAAVDGQTLDKVEGAPLKRGQQGCVRSHMRAWEEASKSDATPFTVIFEDDYIIPENYNSALPQILEEAQEACDGKPADVVWLHRTLLEHGAEDPVTDHLTRATNPSNGMHAYAVSAGGAAKLMDMHNKDNTHFFKIALDAYFQQHRDPKSSSLCMVAADPPLGDVPVSPFSTTEEE